MGANLAALQVVVPLIGAPLCALLGRGTRAWALSLVVTWVSFGVAIALLIGTGVVLTVVTGLAQFRRLHHGAAELNDPCFRFRHQRRDSTWLPLCPDFLGIRRPIRNR